MLLTGRSKSDEFTPFRRPIPDCCLLHLLVESAKFEELGKSFNELSNEDRWEIMSKSGGSALRILLAAFMWYMFFVYVFVSAIWLAFFVALTSF